MILKNLKNKIFQFRRFYLNILISRKELLVTNTKTNHSETGQVYRENLD